MTHVGFTFFDKIVCSGIKKFRIPQEIIENQIYDLTIIFATQQSALDTLQRCIESMAIHEDDIQNWELVKCSFDVVPNSIAKYL